MTKGEFGALQIIRNIQGYSVFTTLGITQAVLFELPLAIGREDRVEVDRIQKFYNTLLLATGLISVVLFGFFAFFAVPLNGVRLEWVWILLGALIALSGWTSYSQLLFQSYQDFGRLGVARFIYPVFFAVTAVLILPAWKVTGFLAAMVLGYLALSAYGLYQHRSTLGFYWDTKRFWNYIQIGLPIRLNSFVWMLITSIGLWLASLYIGPDEAGIYGFAMLISTAYGLIPGVLSEMGMPRISVLFGRSCNTDFAPLEGPARHSLVAFAGINVLPAILSLMAFDMVITYFLPKYKQAEPAMVLLVIGYYLNSICALAGNILVLLRQQRLMLMVSLAVLVAVAALGYGSAVLIGTSSAVAASTMIGLGLNSLITFWLIARKIDFQHLGALILKLAALSFLGVAAIAAWWGAVQYFSGWTKILAFLVIGAFLGGAHTFIGIKSLSRFWKLTAAGPIKAV